MQFFEFSHSVRAGIDRGPKRALALTGHKCRESGESVTEYGAKARSCPRRNVDGMSMFRPEGVLEVES